MSNNASDAGKTAISINGFVIFIVFLVLKLTGQITWSWVWVTSPLWLPLALLLALVVLLAFFAFIYEFVR